MKIKNNSIDLIAFSSAIICAVHCAVIPIILSFSSLSSLHFLENPLIEWIFIGLGLLFAITSLWSSYKKVHHQPKPLLFSALGFTLIALGRLNLTELWELVNTITGAFIVALAHYLNWKLLRNIGNHKY